MWHSRYSKWKLHIYYSVIITCTIFTSTSTPHLINSKNNANSKSHAVLLTSKQFFLELPLVSGDLLCLSALHQNRRMKPNMYMYICDAAVTMKAKQLPFCLPVDLEPVVVAGTWWTLGWDVNIAISTGPLQHCGSLWPAEVRHNVCR